MGMSDKIWDSLNSDTFDALRYAHPKPQKSNHTPNIPKQRSHIHNPKTAN